MDPKTGDTGGQEDSKKEETKVPSLLEAQGEAVREAKRLRASAGAAGNGAPAAVSGKPRKIERIIPLAEADAVQEALYAKRQRIFPRQVSGFFARWRIIMVLVTLGVYYFLPWINWGEGRQAFLIDLPGRKFHLFSWTFWPQDLFFLTGILIISALALFLFTAVAGRLWCGYTCPQTVWTEVFLWIERRIEGDRNKQMRLASGPWNAEKIRKRTLKHLAWGLFALWTGFTFVGYVTPIRDLTREVLTFSLGPWEIFWILFYGFATYGNAGWLREQVCVYMCPYARFQSAMFDRDTLIISYDPNRGEPRGSRKRAEDHKGRGLGDCVDCTLCVQVCPTGIDIRDGLQYQCISCGACIDVCDTVMDKMGYPRGLIRYTTENELELGKPRHVLRPRVLIYSGILGALAVALLVAVLVRVPLEFDVLRDRSTLYRESPDGRIENVYTLKIMNKDARPHAFTLGARGIEGVQVRADRAEIAAASGELIELPVTLFVEPAVLKARSTPVTFVLQTVGKDSYRIEQPTRFVGPGK